LSKISATNLEQLMALFKVAKDEKYEKLRQEAVHSLVFLAKCELPDVLPFERYMFSRYFTPFSKYLQEDVDDAVASNLLERELTKGSAEWLYWITNQGDIFAQRVIESQSKESVGKIAKFLEDNLGPGLDVLFERSYKRLNEEIYKAIKRRL